MNETAGMLETRLRLIDRIRRVEHELSRDEQAKAAAALLEGRSHDLGNHIQIVKLSALELERRGRDRPDLAELLADLRQAAEQTSALLANLIAIARPPERSCRTPCAPRSSLRGPPWRGRSSCASSSTTPCIRSRPATSSRR
jgi:K+-sensing histidine kinase KdpD